MGTSEEGVDHEGKSQDVRERQEPRMTPSFQPGATFSRDEDYNGQTRFLPDPQPSLTHTSCSPAQKPPTLTVLSKILAIVSKGAQNQTLLFLKSSDFLTAINCFCAPLPKFVCFHLIPK